MKKKNLISDPNPISYKPLVDGSKITSELILKKLKTAEPASQTKNSFPHFNEDEFRKTLLLDLKNILTYVKKELKKLYNDNLVEVILYGSYARGDYSENSDIDLLVVLKHIESAGKEIDKIVDATYDITLKYSALISVVPISYDDYKNINSPLLLNVRKEGVLVE